MMRSVALSILVLFFADCFAVTINPFDDGLLHTIQWQPDVDTMPDGESMYIRTKEGEQYVCKINTEEKGSADDLNSAETKDLRPADVLAPIMASSQCMYEVQSYWTYEYCPGREMRQYHEEQIKMKRIRSSEFILGREQPGSSAAPASDESAEQSEKVPNRRIGDHDYPYYSILLTEGTQCDVTGALRQTEVLFICEENAGNPQMLSIKETRSCEYEAIVATALLCAIPAYRAAANEVRSIPCFPAEGSPAKPKAQTEFDSALQVGQSSLRKTVRVKIGNKEAVFLEVNAQPGQNFQNAPSESPDNPTVNFLGEQEPDSSGHDKASQAEKDSHRDKPLKGDVTLIRQFLKGEFCLHGGQGWWHYEFCYGRHVLQYHQDEATREKTEILLGRWDLADHKEWFSKASPRKRFPKLSVVHHYSGGSTCDVTGKPRAVSVRMRCAQFDHAHQVSMYLEEPSTCIYTLTVESNIVCQLLQTIDKDGLLHLND